MISDNWVRVQVAGKPMFPSSVTKSKLKYSKPMFEPSTSKFGSSKSRFESSKSKFKTSKSKFKPSRSKAKQTAATMRPRGYSKSRVQPSDKSNARRTNFGKTGKRSEEDTTGKMFVIHTKRRTQRREKSFARSSKYGDYLTTDLRRSPQEEETNEYLSGESSRGSDSDTGDNIYIDYDTSEAPELKKALQSFSNPLFCLPILSFTFQIFFPKSLMLVFLSIIFLLFNVRAFSNSDKVTVSKEEPSTAAAQGGQALPETTLTTTSVTTTPETPLETTLQCWGPFCIG